MAIFAERDIISAPVLSGNVGDEVLNQRLIYYEPFGDFDMAVTEDDDGEGSFIFFKRDTLEVTGFYAYGILDSATIGAVAFIYITMAATFFGNSFSGQACRNDAEVKDALTIALDPLLD